MSAVVALLHTATMSHEFGVNGPLFRALCTTCSWEGQVRDTASEAWGDGLDHEDGIEVTS